MPREINPLVRKSGFFDAEKFYILAYEGTLTETKYFDDLRLSEYFNDSGNIETIPFKKRKNTGNSPIDVKKLLSKAKTEYNFRHTDEFWIIIDRDDWETIHNIDFNTLYANCKSESINVAFSNPCFEMWLVFHLQSLSVIPEAEQKKLFENKKVSNKHHYIDNFLARCIGNGKGYNKRPDPKVFLPKVHDAIKNAQDASKPSECWPSYLGSDVYKLVSKLIK